MGASFFAIPELEIAESEAQQLGDAVKRVGDHYDVKATEKSLAWTNLMTVLAMVYGTRMFAYRARKADEKKSSKQNVQTPNVLHMGNLNAGGMPR
jgi:hypothetical protein